MASYQVQAFQTIYDICYNVAGSVVVLDKLMELNGIDSYTAEIPFGTQIDITGIPIVNNACVLWAAQYPFYSTRLSEEDLQNQINNLVNTMTQNGKSNS